jgi:hypothetical protein
VAMRGGTSGSALLTARVSPERTAAPNMTMRPRVLVMGVLRPSWALRPRLTARSVVSTTVPGRTVAIRDSLDQQRVVLGPRTPSHTNPCVFIRCMIRALRLSLLLRVFALVRGRGPVVRRGRQWRADLQVSTTPGLA